MKQKILYLLIVGSILLVFSCEKDKGPVIIKPIVPVDPVDTFIHFGLYVQPIFDEFCTRCHNQSHPFLDLQEGVAYTELWTDGSSAPYVDTVDPGNSRLMQHLEGVLERMPPESPYPLTSQIDSIRQWMWQGARNN